MADFRATWMPNVIATERPLSYDDLQDLPDDGLRREVIGGDLFVSPAPSAGHQNVVASIYRLIFAYASHHGGQVFFAPFDVVLGPFDVVQPDLLYLAPTRPPVPEDQHALVGTPDLVVEVLSPGTGLIDRTRKLALYATSGVPEFWIADPVRRQFILYVLHGDEFKVVEPDAGGLITSRALPGLHIDPSVVFSNLA